MESEQPTLRGFSGGANCLDTIAVLMHKDWHVGYEVTHPRWLLQAHLM